MGYWGWRPLVCGVFMSTWITGCTIVASTDAPMGTATPYPPITLISGRLPDPTAPPSGGARPLSLSPVPPVAAGDLRVSPPVCYETGERLVCLGMVSNAGEMTSGRVIVDLLLEGTDDAGEAVALRGAAAIDQTILPAGADAPYSISLISRIRPESLTRAQVSLRAGAENIPPLLTTLRVDEVMWHVYDDGLRWQVAGQAVNTGNDAVRPVRLVSVLLDATDRVLGYRVIALNDMEALPPGAARALTADVFSVARPPAEGVRATLHVEGEVIGLTRRR
jgi:hypothetical protein